MKFQIGTFGATKRDQFNFILCPSDFIHIRCELLLLLHFKNLHLTTTIATLTLLWLLVQHQTHLYTVCIHANEIAQ